MLFSASNRDAESALEACSSAIMSDGNLLVAPEPFISAQIISKSGIYFGQIIRNFHPSFQDRFKYVLTILVRQDGRVV